MRKLWHDEAWEEYLYWQSQDKKTLKKINRLLTDIDRNGFEQPRPTCRTRIPLQPSGFLTSGCFGIAI